MTEYDLNYFEKLSKELEVSEEISPKRFTCTVWVNHVLETHLEEMCRQLEDFSSIELGSYSTDLGMDPSFYSWVSWGVSYLEENSSYSGNEISVFFQEIEEQLQENCRLLSSLRDSSVNTLSETT